MRTALLRVLARVEGPGIGLTRIPGLRRAYERFRLSLLPRLAKESAAARVEAFGFTFNIDPADETTFPLILGGYEDREVERFAAAIESGATVVDVGANVGVYTLTARRAAGPTGRVIAVEPNPRVVPLLRANVDANPQGAPVEIVDAAASAKSGSTTLHLDARNQGLASLFRANVTDRDDAVLVRAITIDSLVAPGCLDVLKLDVQGAELAVLRGARAALAANATVFYELWPAGLRAAATSPDELLDLFLELGFRLETLESEPLDIGALREQVTADVAAVNIVARRGDQTPITVKTSL